jgi:signal transduction histidine kinase/ActR/RegA family two-component response regulator
VQGGADRVLLYNDAYVASLGAGKHPWALGRPTRDVWPGAAKQMELNLAALLAGGPPIHHDDARFIIEREGRPEETYWTYALSLIRDADRRILGLLTFAIETTTRVRAEDARRASEARQAFLLTLSDAMRRLTDPNEMQATASRLLGAHLAVSQAMYAEVEGEAGNEHGTVRGLYVHEGTPFPSRIEYSAFGKHVGDRYRRGETVVVSDVLADPEFDDGERSMWLAAGIRAAIGVSLVKDGRFLSNFGVVNATPRAWTTQEVALVRETAERTWEAAERARAEAARDRLLEGERRARAEADAARDRTERLQRLSAELTRCATMDTVVNAVLRQLILALGARQAGVFELSEDTRELRLLGAEGVDDETRALIARVSVDTPLPLGEVIRTRVPVVVDSSAAWQLAHPDVPVRSHDYDRAWAALPLRVENGREERLLGGLTVTFVGPRRFADDEVAFLQTFADLCAQALARTRLVEAEHLRVVAEAARAKAEAESRAKDDLLAAVSHELRAPLAPARALAQALARKELPSSEVREMAVEIDRHIAYQARLVADLLDYQRVTRSHLATPRHRCDIHEIARGAMRAAAPALNKRLIRVTEDFSADHPVVWADRVRVQQIVYNLLSNASKFSPFRAPVIVRTWNPTPEWVELAVVDSGVGISHEFLAHLFEPFVQGTRRQAARSGLGLGLALSRRLAELQGGTLTAESKGRGQGATFTLRLPTASGPGASSTHEAPSAAAPDSPTDSRRPLRILVIEDDVSTGRALRRLLTLDGHVVHVAESLAAAERIAEAEPLDVALADLHLGAESGLAAPRRLAEAAGRRGRPAPPTIVLSGFDRDSDLAESRAAGFVAHLAKPVEEEVLLLAVQRAAGAGPFT